MSACSPKDTPGTDSTPPPDNPPGGSTLYEREIRGGRLHNVAVDGITETAGDPTKLAAIVQAELRGRLGAIQSGDFVEVHRNVTPARGGARLQFVTLRQTVGGVPVDDTYLHIGVRYSAQGTKLVSSSYRLFENIPVDTRPAVTRQSAVALAHQGLRLRSAAAPVAEQLVVHQLGDRLQLAWSFLFPGSHDRAFVVASGDDVGRVHVIDQRVFSTTGTVSGPVVRDGAPGGQGVVDIKPMPNSLVSGVLAQTSADANGAYTVIVPDGSALTASLSGKAANVLNVSGPAFTATGTAVDGGVTDLTFTSTVVENLAQSTAYYTVDQVRLFLEENGMDPAVFGAPLTTNANINDFCNAFFSPGGRSINFFKAGGGCNNSAIDSVIAHEYGHFIDHINGSITNGGLSEGWGDLLACYWSKQPVVGFDLFVGGGAVRNCDNDYVFPPTGVDEVHALGQAWMGFAWDARENLIALLGEEAGDELARELVLPGFASNAPDIPEAVREVFLRDDDDGDLSNQTPHWNQLIPAAVHHGVAFTVDPDEVAPAAVMDLAIASVKPTLLKVTWTASGDDGTTGTAASYQLRWSTAPITPANFPAANLVPTGAPKQPGQMETANAVVPPESTIFVALIVTDEQFNSSQLSNVVSATTPAGTAVFEESAEGNVDGWTMTGLWHVTTKRASQGTHSFWYGQEATGNYNTPGMANAGDLTSPTIDLTVVGAPVLTLDQFIDVEPNPFDVAQVIISDVDDPAHQTLLQKDKFFSAGAFQPRVIPLTGFDGKRIKLRFHFDTIDSIANGTEGWYLDKLKIIGSETCDHSPCVTGTKLDPSCSPCVAAVCAFDSFCCNVTWDSICVNEAKTTCNLTCPVCGNGVCEAGETTATCPQDCAPPCAHDVCEPGEALDQTCDTCATSVCAADPFCCTVFWDRVCVQEAETICGKNCDGCAHDFCAVGEPLENNCDPCAATVCGTDPFCCTTSWDSRCVQEAADACNLACTVCSHSLCAQGTPLETTCDPCVTAVCAADPYCCTGTWDQRCIDEAETTCGLACLNDRNASPRPPENPLTSRPR